MLKEISGDATIALTNAIKMVSQMVHKEHFYNENTILKPLKGTYSQ